MSDILDKNTLTSAREIKSWIEEKIRELVKRHDNIAEHRVLPTGKFNINAIEEGRLSLYHIGALSELLVLIKEVNNL